MKLSEKSIDHILQAIPAIGLVLLLASSLLPDRLFSDRPRTSSLVHTNRLLYQILVDSRLSSDATVPVDAASAAVAAAAQAASTAVAVQVDPLKPRLFELLEAATPGESQGEAEVLDLLDDSDQCKFIYGQQKVTPLMLAAGNSNVIVVLKLLQCGAEVNRTNGYGSTALMYAASAGRTENVKALLDKGADRNIIDAKGESALAMATQQLHIDIVEILRKK